MIGKGANEIRPVTLSEVERILEKRQGTVGEFGFEQQTTLDYARKFARLKLQDAQELFKGLVELGLKPETAVKVVDLLPVSRSQLLLIMAKDRAELSEKKTAELSELVAKFLKKAKKVETGKDEDKPAEAAMAPAENAEAKEEKKG